MRKYQIFGIINVLCWVHLNFDLGIPLICTDNKLVPFIAIHYSKVRLTNEFYMRYFAGIVSTSYSYYVTSSGKH